MSVMEPRSLLNWNPAGCEPELLSFALTSVNLQKIDNQSVVDSGLSKNEDSPPCHPLPIIVNSFVHCMDPVMKGRRHSVVHFDSDELHTVKWFVHLCLHTS